MESDQTLQFSVNKLLAVLSDLDWWIARVLSLGKDMQPTIFQNENIKLSGYTLRYIFSNPADL